MSQLIALIIAIALGAIVTAIGYVYLGDAFTNNSVRGNALTLIGQGSQLEMAMTAYRASNAGSAFETDYTLTLSNDGAGGSGSTNGLIPEGYLKSDLSPPLGLTYTLLQDSGDVYLVAQGTEISQDLCRELKGMAQGTGAVAATAVTSSSVEFTNPATGGEVAGALGSTRYDCFQDTTTTAEHVYIYEVE